MTTRSSSDNTVHLGGRIISDRVVAQLLEELRTGRWAGADRLPAELDLAGELGVSRTVIRDALSTMERAGYVERVRGIGTVVNRAVLSLRSRLDQKLEYYPLIRSFGSYPHADGIQIQPLRASGELAQSLEVEPGADLICIRKRVLADSTPVIYSINYLPRSLLGGQDYTKLDLGGSIFGAELRAAGVLHRGPHQGQLRGRRHPHRHAPGPRRGHAAAGRSVLHPAVPPGAAGPELLHQLFRFFAPAQTAVSCPPTALSTH